MIKTLVKYTLCLLTVISLVACSNRIDSNDELVNLVFNSLVTEDYQSFNQLIASDDDLIRIAEQVLTTDKLPPDQQAMLQQSIDELRDPDNYNGIKLRQSLQRTGDIIVLLHAQLTDLQWRQAQILNYTVETTKNLGIEHRNITVFFQVESQVYGFMIVDAIFTSDGFYLYRPIIWIENADDFYRQQ